MGGCSLNSRIYRKAVHLRKETGSQDPFDALESLHARVKLSRQYAPDGLKGFCTIMNRTRFVVINDYLPEFEKRVVAGHELGHLVCNADELRIQGFRDYDVYNPSSSFERDANFFAADFMLDDEDVLDAMHSGGADFFNVASALCIPAPFFAFKLYSMVDRGFPIRMPVDLNSAFLASR